jgi:hypothetical protein
MSDNEEINALEKRIELLNTELQRTNLLGNKNLPALVKYIFLFVFFLIMSFLKPDLVIKIVEIFINSFSTIKTIGLA